MYCIINLQTGRVIVDGLTWREAKSRERSYNRLKGSNGQYAVCSLTEGGWWVHI
jgi:hypothetical protein